MLSQILDKIDILHQAIYDHMATIKGIRGLEFLGFDDGKSRPPLPKVAMHLSFGGYEVDRGRVIPSIYKPAVEKTLFYGGEAFTVTSEFDVERPLPVDLFYEIDTWCHDSRTSLAMDAALMATLPERGALNLTLHGSTVAFPIELLGIQDLDDLTQNIREKVYRYKVEAWIPSWLGHYRRKVITTPIEELHSSAKPLQRVALMPDL